MPKIKIPNLIHKTLYRRDLRPVMLLWGLCLVFLIHGCTGRLLPSELSTSEPVQGEGFVIVTVKAGDTFASLAATHLNDPRKGWRIAEYNDIQEISAGQKLVIPLAPTSYGGLQTKGYQTVPVLLYYQLGDEAKNQRITSTTHFEAQLQHLQQNGFRTITLDEFYAFLSLKDQIPPQSLIITFDTVGAWVYDIAYPLLKKYGMTAAVFITTEDIEKPGNLSWGQLKAMVGDGFDIGTLGHSGKNLLNVKPDEKAETYLKRLESEIASAKATIEKHTHSVCHYFAYPTGETNDLLTAMLKKHGFYAAFNRKRGSNPFFIDPFLLRRSLIYGHYDLAQFKQNLSTFRSAELK